MKVIRLTESEFKEIIDKSINGDKEVYEFDSDWKKELIDSIKDIKGQSHSILKSVTSTDELDYENKDKENYIEDLEKIKELVDNAIFKLKNYE